MQSIEAVMSLLAFLSIASLALSFDRGPPQIDDSLHRLQLAEDAWRVLYLRDGLRELGPEKRGVIETDMRAIGEQTGFCIFMSGVEFTNCRGGTESHDDVVSIHRTVILGDKPLRVRFTLSR